VPVSWAATQNNLGATLLTLGRRESRTARLEEAVAAFRAALEELSRDRVPFDWAATQHNLGTALSEIGERESGTAHLEAAVAAYQAALQEYTRDQVPLYWAMSTGNEGVALKVIGERLGDRTKCRVAIKQIEEAVTVLQDGGDEPGAAYYKEQLQQTNVFLDQHSAR
jgi:tetratricopeptide (TPR) repeat protein